MKYFYISCLLLSSFFTYKTLSANDNYPQYAFFMPQGAFGQNTQLNDIESMRPRQPKESPAPAPQLQEEEPVTPPITLPYVKKKIKVPKEITAPKPAKTAPIARQNTPNIAPNKPQTPPKIATPTPKTISPEILEKLNKYSLEPPAAKTQTVTADTQPQAPLPTKTLSEMLSSIPYPNPALPKFKQLYASYAMDLRIYNRRGTLPANPEQEQALQKADSIRRFEVK